MNNGYRQACLRGSVGRAASLLVSFLMDPGVGRQAGALGSGAPLRAALDAR